MSFIKIGDAQPINIIKPDDIDVKSTGSKLVAAKQKVKALPNVLQAEAPAPLAKLADDKDEVIPVQIDKDSK
jgi:hypothetical protein